MNPERRVAAPVADAGSLELPLRRQRSFALLWTASTASELGTAVSELALPLCAIVTLGAGPLAVGLLSTAEFAPYLLLSLPAGAWVDRVPRRPVLIGCDLVRVAAMSSVPLAWWSGHLVMVQLYAVAFTVAALTIVFDVTFQAWLPDLVSREKLVAANAGLQVGEQSCAVAGPGIGGLLVAASGAPVAVLADAMSYLFSAALLVRIRHTGYPAERGAGARRGVVSLVADIREGVGFVSRHCVLRAVATTSALASLFGRAVYVVLLLHLVRDAGMNAATIGLLLSLGSVGFVAGAVAAPRIIEWLGAGGSIVTAAAVIPASLVLLALTIGRLAAPLTIVGFGLYGLAAVVFTVSSLSLRQSAMPRELLGRVNATMRFVSWGTLPLAGVMGGLLGAAIGLTPTMLLCAACATTGLIPVLLAPVRRLATLNLPVTVGGDSSAQSRGTT